MITKLYKPMATGVVISMLLAMLTVAPVSAQSSSATAQDPCATLAQNLGQVQNSNTAQNSKQGSSQNSNQNSNGQATLGTSPSTAATPVANCWLSIAPGQKHWYKFHVGARSNRGDENNNFNNSNGVDDSDAAIVQLAMDVPGCVTFEIWTLDRLNAPPPVGSDASREEKRKDKEIARGPVGVGSPEFAIVDTNEHSSGNSSNNSKNANNDKNKNLSRLIWRGGSTVSENFYIVVRNVRTDFTCHYRLSVAGPTVTFPGTNNNG